MKIAAGNRGSILVTTLWIMAILSLFATGIGARTLIELRLSKYRLNRLQAGYLAKAGLVKARERISKDAHGEYDSLYECGVSFDEEKKETPETVFGEKNNRLGAGSFSVHYIAKEGMAGEEAGKYYGVEDEDRKINVRLSCLLKMKNYRDMLKRLLPDDADKDEVVDAIINWQDSLADDPYYAELKYPYACRNADFKFVEELLLVKGVTPEIFDELKDYVTVYGEGTININTAPEKVLSAVTGDEELAELIAGHTRSEKGEAAPAALPRDERNYFINLDEVKDFLRNGGMGPKGVNEIDSRFDVKSNNFRITSRGTAARMTKAVTCAVKRNSDGRTEVVYYHED